MALATGHRKERNSRIGVPVVISPVTKSALPGKHNMTMLAISLLFVLLYVFRETGGVPVVAGLHGVVDDIVIAAANLLAFTAAGVSLRMRLIHVAVALVAISLAVAGSLTEVEWSLQAANLASGYLVLATCVSLLEYVLRRTRVTGDTVFGALAVYLAIGVLFGGVFTMMALETPTAFDPPEFVKFGGETALYYYSFVTLTTLGFGDITPTSDLAQILTTLEAILGLVVIAVLVGRVVGLLVSQQATEEADQRRVSIAARVERLENMIEADQQEQGHHGRSVRDSAKGAGSSP